MNFHKKECKSSCRTSGKAAQACPDDNFSRPVCQPVFRKTRSPKRIFPSFWGNFPRFGWNFRLFWGNVRLF
jgi:hypothetical protein